MPRGRLSATALALVAALGVAAPALAADGASNVAERRAQARAQFEALSPEERQARIEQLRAQREARTDRRAAARERFRNLPPEKQAEVRERVREGMQQRRQRPPQS
jgi:hypothetical protein